MSRPSSALLLGAITRDPWREQGSERSGPGGGVHHAGLALARLGLRVRVVTRVRSRDRGELLAPLERAGVEVLALPSRETTTYRNDYATAEDEHELLECSDTLTASDVPEAWRVVDLVQLSPLHPDDLDVEIAAVLRARIGLDAQGLLRTRGLGPARAASTDALVRGVNVLQVSEAESVTLLGPETASDLALRRGVDELLITRGARGVSLVEGAVRTEVPIRPVRVHHPRAKTGAGDTFLACYLWQRTLGAKPEAAIRTAAALCARKLEHGELPEELAP